MKYVKKFQERILNKKRILYGSTNKIANIGSFPKRKEEFLKEINNHCKNEHWIEDQINEVDKYCKESKKCCCSC